MMKKWMKGIVAAGVSLLVANSVSAATMELDMGAGSVNWTNPLAWTSDTVPVTGDSVFIRRANTVTISSDAGTMGRLFVGDGSSYGYTGTVNIVAGGSLNLTNTSVTAANRNSIGRASTAGAVGYLNLSGGTLNMGLDGSRVLYIGADDTANCTGVFTISGGTFNGRMLVGSASAGDINDSDILRIVGSGATIGTSDTVGDALNVRASGRLEFVFDAAGISTLDYGATGAGGRVTLVTGTSMLIDGSAYTGPAGTFTLLTCGELVQNFSEGDVTFTGFGDGSYYTVDAANDVITVTVVPEPATIGMIGVGALVAMMVRRQMRK